MLLRLILWPFRALHRIWLRLDLAWIRDQISDEEARHARHAITMRGWRAEEAGILHKLGGRPSQKYGLQGLRQRRRA